MADLQVEIIALADYASLSKENKLTIAGIFDRISVSKLPARWPKMFLVLVLKGEPESEHKLELAVYSETGKEYLFKRKLKIKLGRNGKASLITSLVNFPLKWPGKHEMMLTEGEKKVGYFLFSVWIVGGADAKKNAPQN